MNLPICVDNLINKFHKQKGDYPSKIIMKQEVYDKLIAESKEQDLSDCWLDFSAKNYKGIPIEIESIEDIKLE
jgi:hypothetical protein